MKKKPTFDRKTERNEKSVVKEMEQKERSGVKGRNRKIG
ncbi:unnamed protein product, partial [Rhizophagus irregularis]